MSASGRRAKLKRLPERGGAARSRRRPVIFRRSIVVASFPRRTSIRAVGA